MEKYNKIKNIIYIVIFFIFSIFVRCGLIYNISGDFILYLNEWFTELKNNGGIFALNMNIGNYNMPYIQILALLTYLPLNPLYSIKLVSIIFDYIGACLIGVLIYKIKHNKDLAIVGSGIVLISPTVFLNSSAWAQCDFIYVTFIILSLIFLIDKKYILSFIFLGLAFSFKLQTIFVLPIFIIYYISERKFPIYYFAIIPIVNLIMCIPSIIMGKSVIDVFKIYIGQVSEYDKYISMNFPGIYNLFLKQVADRIVPVIEMPNKLIEIFAICGVGMIYFSMAIYVFVKKYKFSKELIIEFATCSVILCTYLLPKMHDRYMFAADVLSIVCVFINKKFWYLPIVVNLSSLYVYILYLTKINININIKIISIILGIALIVFTIQILKELKKYNESIKEN